ncbi:agmatinase [Candidatus Palauibacter sp.]|uniref:agmatinase n=1 Tax=Candidatus Palauibacter sp. TaxID=3101350 RepID=UPI003B5301BF
MSRWEAAGVVILPVPYEATTSWGTGTREGPAAIIEASRYIEWYDEELDREPYEVGVCTLPSIDLGTAGPEPAIARLRALYDDLLEAAGDRFVIGLGGEHSISSAPATAWVDRLDGDVTILQFDAHTDLRDRHHHSPWNHACVMRRVLEYRADGGNAADIVAVGIRALTLEERDVIRERGIEVVFAHEMRRPGWVGRAVEALGENVYITFDVDFFDPSLIPATGTPEPGGGSWWDAMDLLSRVFRERNVVGADIVELAPRPGGEASAFTAAKLAYKMIGFRSEQP